MHRRSAPGCIWSARAAAVARRDLGRDHPPGDRLAAPQLTQPRHGSDHHAEPAAPDIPAIDTDVDSGELIAAQLPQIFAMHDPSHGSQVRPRSPVQIPRPASSDIVRLHPVDPADTQASDRNPHATVGLFVFARAEAADPDDGATGDQADSLGAT